MVKLARDAVLELETRRRLYEVIAASPGLHFRELERRLDLAYGTLQYHLEFLIKHGLIVQETVGDYARFFPSGFKSIRERELLSLLRQKTVRHVLLSLLENPSLRNRDLVARLKLSASTISWHLGKLVSSGAVVQESRDGETVYRVSEPEAVIRLLVTYKTSFVDKIVDRFIELWEKENASVLHGSPGNVL
jgi:predicted transcriptional regulator